MAVYGSKFGNIKDIERCGLFGEMSYMVGKGYTAPLVGGEGVRDLKSSQMYPSYTKTKTDLQDCYFDTKFKRLFIGEAHTSQFHRERQAEIEASKKNLSRAFVPSSYTKKPSCPGAYDACIGGRVTAFSPLKRDVKLAKPKLLPIYPPSPGKKGGTGYVDICLNPYPKTSGEPYDDAFVSAQDGKRQGERVLGFVSGGHPTYFQKNPWYTSQVGPTYKRVFDKLTTLHGAFYGGGKAREKGDSYHGGMSKYPEYKSPNVGKSKSISAPKKLGGAFYPQARDKTFYTNSVMNRKIDIAVNNTNWRVIQPVTYTKEYI